MHRPPRMSLRLKEMRCENASQTKRANGVTKTVMCPKVDVPILRLKNLLRPDDSCPLFRIARVVKHHERRILHDGGFDEAANVGAGGSIGVGHRNQPFRCSRPVTALTVAGLFLAKSHLP